MAATIEINRRSKRSKVNNLLNSSITAVKVGFFNPKIAKIASIQEYGAMIPVTNKMRSWFALQGVYLRKDTTHIEIPPRPFMRQTVAKYKNEWPELFARILKSTNYDVESSLKNLGSVVQGQIQKLIIEGDFQPNAPLTIKLKGRDLPLRNTGEMLDSVTWELDR